MPNGLYDYGRNLFARGDIAWRAAGGSTIRVFLVSPAYRPELGSARFLSQVDPAFRFGNLGSSERANAPRLILHDPEAGVCDAEDLRVKTPPAGLRYNGAVIFMDDDQADEASPLIAYISEEYGAEEITNGADIVIPWNDGPDRIFKL